MSEVEELEVIIKKIKYKGIIWIPETNRLHNLKENYFVKWMIENKQVGDIFSLDEFYKEHPKHKTDAGCKRRLNKIVSDLIKEERIEMWVHKDEFKVLKI